MVKFLKKVSTVCYVNDFDTNDRAWVPEVWAQETLKILEENMVAGNLVHTDFSNEISEFGDVVNTRRPGTFRARRKGVNDDVTVQDATADNIQVPLNQHIHTSFMIRDGEESKSFKDLTDQYFGPAAKSLAEEIDRILLGQVYQFLDYSAGTLGALTDTTAKATILDTRNVMNKNNCPVVGRNMIVTPDSETELLKTEIFLTADKVGDEGTALREASLGRKLGFDFFMCQNASSILATSATQRTLHGDELAADAAAGATVLTLDAGVVDNGQYITLEGDEQPLRVISGGATTTITVDRPLRTAVTAAASDLYEYHGCTIDLTGHVGITKYPAGYDKEIKVDTGAAPLDNATPLEGQLVSFYDVSGTAIIAGEYSIIEVVTDGSDVYIRLDRPLEVALEDGDYAYLGPAGDYNLAFRRDSIALVTRPLAQPKPGTGAISGVASYNNLSMRVVITYDGKAQGHLVTLDVLAGVKIIDEKQGAVMLG